VNTLQSAISNQQSAISNQQIDFIGLDKVNRNGNLFLKQNTYGLNKQDKLIQTKHKLPIKSDLTIGNNVNKLNKNFAFICRKSKQLKGFTTIELLIGIVILGILATIAYPHVKEVLADRKINMLASNTLMSLRLARNEAVSNGKIVLVCKTKTNGDQEQCELTNDWTQGINLVRGDTALKQLENVCPNCGTPQEIPGVTPIRPFATPYPVRTSYPPELPHSGNPPINWHGDPSACWKWNAQDIEACFLMHLRAQFARDGYVKGGHHYNQRLNNDADWTIGHIKRISPDFNQWLIQRQNNYAASGINVTRGAVCPDNDRRECYRTCVNAYGEKWVVIGNDGIASQPCDTYNKRGATVTRANSNEINTMWQKAIEWNHNSFIDYLHEAAKYDAHGGTYPARDWVDAKNREYQQELRIYNNKLNQYHVGMANRARYIEQINRKFDADVRQWQTNKTAWEDKEDKRYRSEVFAAEYQKNENDRINKNNEDWKTSPDRWHTELEAKGDLVYKVNHNQINAKKVRVTNESYPMLIFNKNGMVSFYDSANKAFKSIDATVKIRINDERKNEAKGRIICVNAVGNMQLIAGNKSCFEEGKDNNI